MDDYLREMIEEIYKQEYEQAYKEAYEQSFKQAYEQSAFENLILNIKSLINKGYSFDKACYLLDIDDKIREKLLETGDFN